MKMKMSINKNRTLSKENLQDLNFGETKMNVTNYFNNLELLELEWAKVNIQKGLTADLWDEYMKQPYVVTGKDMFKLSAKELTEEKLKEQLSNYYWATSILTEEEQIYIMEYFVCRKYEDEIVDLLGFNNTNSREYRHIKRSAVYKFANFLNLLVVKTGAQ